MKKPSNKAKAIYLAWGLLHFTLWAIATPGLGSSVKEYESRFKFFPFAQTFEDSQYDCDAFDIDRVYDFTEFLFYMIAPILIYYIITLWKTKDEADK